jgi:hypothetical protein
VNMLNSSDDVLLIKSPCGLTKENITIVTAMEILSLTCLIVFSLYQNKAHCCLFSTQ